MRKYDLILFDLDGTLADTSEGIYNAHRFASQKAGYALKENDLDGVIGMSLLAVYREKFGLPEETARYAVSEYRKWYAEEGRLEAKLYPGMLETLKSLKNQGYHLGVATLKLEAFAKDMLEAFGVAEYFDHICGVDANDNLSKADIINIAIKKAGIAKERTVLVGDSDNDAKGAREAGIDFIACLYGFGYMKEEEALKDGGKAAISRIEELQNALEAGQEKRMPLISIIVPVYNTKAYLESCVRSILAQTYKNIEIILVDDGSSDGSGKLCDRIAKEDSKIQVIHKENGGPSSARNTGLGVSGGEFVLFCDSDDTVCTEWAERLLVAAEAHTSSLTICGYELYDPAGKQIRKVSVAGGIYALQDYFKLFHLTGSSCIKIYRNDLLKKYGIRFPEHIRYGEDVLFNIDYISLEEVTSFYVINTPLYQYLRYQPEPRVTLSEISNVSYYDLRTVHEKRLPFIAQEDRLRYKKLFFGNIWKRFNQLPTLKNISIIERKKEEKAIVSDDVFREVLNDQGESIFDAKSLI